MTPGANHGLVGSILKPSTARPPISPAKTRPIHSLLMSGVMLLGHLGDTRVMPIVPRPPTEFAIPTTRAWKPANAPVTSGDP